MKEEDSVSSALRSSRPLARDSRRSRPSEDGGPGSVRPIPLPRREARSNLSKGPRADALLEKLPWQVRATTLITVCGPPIASLILLAVDYFEYWRAVPFDLADFLAALLVFAIPVAYVFGAVPALLGASLYCALLTASSGLLQRGRLTRACVAAGCGGLASGAWFWEQLRSGWDIYALVGALVMAALSLGTPPKARSAPLRSRMHSRASPFSLEAL